MATTYGPYRSNCWRGRLDTGVSANTNTAYNVAASGYINTYPSGKTNAAFTGTLSATGMAKVAAYRAGKSGTNGTIRLVGTTFSFAKKETAYNVSIGFTLYSHKSGGSSVPSGHTYTVPALANYSVTYNTGGGSEVASQTKYYGKNLTLRSDVPTKPNYAFLNWQGSDGNTYLAGDTYTGNTALTLTAVWQQMYPPEVENNGLNKDETYSQITKGFSTLSTTISDFGLHEGRTLSRVILSLVDVNGVLTTQTSTYTYSGTGSHPDVPFTWSITPANEGTFDVILTVIDKENGVECTTSEYNLGRITVYAPKWKRTVTYSTLLPDINSAKYASISVQAYNYSDSTWDDIDGNFSMTEVTGGWSFDITLGAEYVSDSSLTNPNMRVRVQYNHTDSSEKEYRKAFFNTSRNSNFSTGLSNTMFVSGCSLPNYKSRVWWSYVNNPLYFPDTNYVEVGSNDTRVMGLIKVGDYLGAIKQSKTTDTAIYLLYSTSFDDDTTFAIKQGVQGVGAVSQYSFNILGDETLFLSPNGIMAIVPDEDEEHKVQNRSFYVDGKLLAEEHPEIAYSFVYDGKYWMSIDGRCYVLDGNQKNSWGNDKTNLVYEAYYLENIPATCFMKYSDELWFSATTGVFRFRKDGETNAYTDSYDIETDEENVPVKAQWSTILDDDGSLHYLKTMQKKGNVASIYPISGDAYVATAVTEEEFNADKTKYYILVDDEYVQCTSESVYSSTETYYVVNVTTSAEVYIKKDAEEPIYVGEINGEVEETGDIPNELHIRKKVKKYKRLQFILKNEKDEGFGVDSITKSYYLGNYAK